METSLIRDICFFHFFPLFKKKKQISILHLIYLNNKKANKYPTTMLLQHSSLCIFETHTFKKKINVLLNFFFITAVYLTHCNGHCEFNNSKHKFNISLSYSVHSCSTSRSQITTNRFCFIFVHHRFKPL